jgi:hypothetical protein
MLDPGAHQEWPLLLQALFMMARALPVIDTMIVMTIHVEALFTMSSLAKASLRPLVGSSFSMKKWLGVW